MCPCDRFTERTLVFAGFRYNAIDADVVIVRSGPGAGLSQSAGTGEFWVDPVIGAITEIPLNDTWSIALRRDFGGSSVGSDFARRAADSVRWQIDMDDENGSGASRFKYDMAMSGPGFGLSFTF